MLTTHYVVENHFIIESYDPSSSQINEVEGDENQRVSNQKTKLNYFGVDCCFS